MTLLLQILIMHSKFCHGSEYILSSGCAMTHFPELALHFPYTSLSCP